MMQKNHLKMPETGCRHPSICGEPEGAHYHVGRSEHPPSQRHARGLPRAAHQTMQRTLEYLYIGCRQKTWPFFRTAPRSIAPGGSQSAVDSASALEPSVGAMQVERTQMLMFKKSLETLKASMHLRHTFHQFHVEAPALWPSES